MKKYVIKILFLILFIIAFLFSLEAYCEDVLGEIISGAGELEDFAVSASKGNFDFDYIKEYFKKLFFDEFFIMKSVFAPLFWIVILSSVKECFSLSEEISSAVGMLISCACVLLSTELMTSLFENSKDCISQLGDFLFLSFPYICSLLEASGKTLAAAKGTLITLGSANILSYLMENFFLIVVYIYYIMAIASSLIENDIFKSFKKTVRSLIKISLPFIVGLYTTVLGLFLKTSSSNDELLLKTTKTLLSAGIPFLGKILNKSADTVLASIEVLKSQAGIIATVGIVSMLSGSVIKLLCGMILFRILGIICAFFGNEKITVLFNELSDTSALLTGITGTVAVIGIISVVLLI